MVGKVGKVRYKIKNFQYKLGNKSKKGKLDIKLCYPFQLVICRRFFVFKKGYRDHQNYFMSFRI